MQYQQGKNRRNLPNWLCFTARRSEDSSTQRLHHVMVLRQSSHSMTSCPQQIAFPFAVCQAVYIFGGFGEIVFTSRPAIGKLDDSPQHQNISCNATQFNVQLERLMFCKDVCTLYHSTLRQAISRNATLFVCTLYHSIWRWAISRNATPFVRTLCYSTLPWAIWCNAIPFLYRIANECLAIRNWASPFHNFMFQLDMGN